MILLYWKEKHWETFTTQKKILKIKLRQKKIYSEKHEPINEHKYNIQLGWIRSKVK